MVPEPVTPPVVPAEGTSPPQNGQASPGISANRSCYDDAEQLGSRRLLPDLNSSSHRELGSDIAADERCKVQKVNGGGAEGRLRELGHSPKLPEASSLPGATFERVVDQYLSDKNDSEADEDEMWEDEISSSSGSELDLDEGSATRGNTPEQDAGCYDIGQDVQESKTQSYRNALQQYKQSRRALMLSGTGSVGSARSSSERLVPPRAREDNTTPSLQQRLAQRKQLALASTEERAQPHRNSHLIQGLQLSPDPFARPTEAVDDAAPVQRAHDIRFDELRTPRASHPSSPLSSLNALSEEGKGREKADAASIGGSRRLGGEISYNAPARAFGDGLRCPSPDDKHSTIDQFRLAKEDRKHIDSHVEAGERISSKRTTPLSSPTAIPSGLPEQVEQPRAQPLQATGDPASEMHPMMYSPPSAYHSDESLLSKGPDGTSRHVHQGESRRNAENQPVGEPKTPLASRHAPAVDLYAARTSAQSQPEAALSPLPLPGGLPSLSLWDYLREEIVATDFDSTQEMKWERVTNFIAIPFWMEKIMVFGIAVCLDSFLYTFTILPLRFAVALYVWTANLLRWCFGGERRYLHSSHKCDLLKAALIVLSCYILSRVTDASKMYHSVRGQDFVKLSVIFNVLEIADRLCCSFGQDLLDSLFSRATLARRKDGRQPYLRPTGFFLLSLAYILAHTFVLFYQLVTLNVAIMSYDNALLTLLISNQFVEIKGSVFKKFEKENLFQLTCADIVERFQLGLMLSAIALRNLIEVSGISASIEGGTGPLPTSFTVFPSLNMLETIIVPVAIVLASECVVDWLKHAFITKFNHIRPAVYGRFMDVLCRDLVAGPGSGSSSTRKHNFVDQSPIVSRRLGFAALPLACLLIRITSQILGMLRDTSHFDECAAPHSSQGAFKLVYGLTFARGAARMLGADDPEGAANEIAATIARSAAWALTVVIGWVFLVGLKLLLGLNLVSYASHRYATMQQREQEEELNARNRAPIGVDREERLHDAKIAQLVDSVEDDAGSVGMRGQVAPARAKTEVGGNRSSKGPSLMDVSRYSMIKSRIW